MKVKILCGTSGSGKSTYIQKNFPEAVICSADHYFMKSGRYEFSPRELPQAHAKCLKDFNNLLVFGQVLKDIVVIDNTNTTVVEIAPYAALALAYGHDLEILIFKCAEKNLQKVAARNEHGVPEQGVRGQYNRLIQLKVNLPPWWPVADVEVEF